MERLHFGESTPYSALEASIHAVRYALARPICSGKNVLDAACGEGYGSALLAAWGANSVSGIDISAEAINVAKQRFGCDTIEFCVGDVSKLEDIYKEKKFDLIVSLETFEHLDDVEAFLKGIRAVAAPSASIIISCPNDYWYYDENESNPFHKRKYTFEAFKEISEKVLGSATSWHFGGLTAGFGSFRVDSIPTAASDADQTAMLATRDAGNAQLVPVEESNSLRNDNCSFYVGVWGPDIAPVSIVTYPLSMEAADRSFFGGPKISEMQNYIASLEEIRDRASEYERELRENTEKHARELRAAGLRLRAAVAENDALRTKIRELEWLQTKSRADLDTQLAETRTRVMALEEQLRTMPWLVIGIYRKVRPFLPARLLKLCARLLQTGAVLVKKKQS